MNVGENIKKLRELKNYTQQYMAQRLEVSQKTYSNIESSGNQITIELVDQIAKILDVSITKVLELNIEAIFNNTNQQGGLSQLNTATTNNYIHEKEAEFLQKIIDEKNLRISQLESTLLVKDELIKEIRKS